MKAIAPPPEWGETHKLNPYSYQIGMLNALAPLKERLRGIDLNKVQDAEAITLLNALSEQIEGLFKDASIAADRIAKEIACKHRGSDYVHCIVSAPHIGVVWVDAEWHERDGEYTPLYWMAGRVIGETERIVSFPPMTANSIEEFCRELETKVRLRQIKIDDWFKKIEKLAQAIGVVQVNKEDGIWVLNFNNKAKTRQLFCQEWWFILKLLDRLQLVARNEIKSKEIWTWLDAEEEACTTKAIIGGRRVSLIPQKLKTGAFHWVLNFKGRVYVPRHKVWEVKAIVDAGKLEEIERIRGEGDGSRAGATGDIQTF